MRAFLALPFALACLWGSGHSSAATERPSGVQIEQTLSQAGAVEFSSTGRDTLVVRFTGNRDKALTVTIPSGTIAQAADGVRVVTLRAANIRSEHGESVTIEIPIASLASTQPGASRQFHLRGDREDRLQSFLDYAAARDDLPRPTAQLVVLALLEDVTFETWLRFNSAPNQGPATEATIQAIDALGILRQLFPERQFALASDNQLKARALRNPATRAMASQLYGLSIPGNPAPTAGMAPDLGQLLHTKAGDNCPVCKMRQKAEGSVGDL